MKKSLLLFILALAGSSSFSQQLAGELSYHHISGNTYAILVRAYTSTLTAAEKCEIAIYFGDGDSIMAPRVNGPVSGICHDGAFVSTCVNSVKYSEYSVTHTYPGNGTYTIHTDDRYRSAAITNITNSGSTAFHLEAELVINPFSGVNNSPVMFISMLMQCGCTGDAYYFNPFVTNTEGDSIYYGNSFSGNPDYTDPPASSTFYIDGLSGDVIWNTPSAPGNYVYGIKMSEWRMIGATYYYVGSSSLEVWNQLSLCTGINEPLKKTGLTVFPNPSPAEVHFSIDDPGNSTYTLIITNPAGQLIKETELSGNSRSFSNNLPAGMYFYTLKDGNIPLNNGKFVVSGHF